MVPKKYLWGLPRRREGKNGRAIGPSGDPEGLLLPVFRGKRRNTASLGEPTRGSQKQRPTSDMQPCDSNKALDKLTKNHYSDCIYKHHLRANYLQTINYI
jgi:hypothetical protein